MTITLRAVKGAPLTSAELDGNFTDLDGRVTELEDNPPAPVEIAEVTVAGTTFSFEMSDGSTLGPYQIPAVSQAAPAPGTVSGATLTLGFAHVGRYLRVTNVSGCAVTIPPHASVAFTVGTEIHFRQSSAGPISWVAGGGVATIHKRADRAAATDANGAVVTLKNIATDEWDLFGDLALV